MTKNEAQNKLLKKIIKIDIKQYKLLEDENRLLRAIIDKAIKMLSELISDRK